MRRKNLMTALLCAAVVAASTVMAPGVVMAEETEAVTEASTEAATEADTEALTEASTEEALELAERPDYKALDYVELGEYKGLTVEVEPTAVSDDEVLKQIRANAGSDILEEVTEGTVEEGDTANIDYEGKLDGEAFEGGTAKDTDLEIGSGTFIPGFEDGLVGVKIGDTVDLPLTFPENYTEELAGKDVVFTVTVNSVKRMPELTDEVKKAKAEQTEVQEVMQYCRDNMEICIKEDELENVAALKVAMKHLAEKYGCKAIAIQCWNQLQSELGIMPCAANSLLNDEGIPTVCETDIHGAITALMVEAAGMGETRSFFADWTIRHPDVENGELLQHCGPWPISIAKETPKLTYPLAFDHPGSITAEAKHGDVSLVRFDGDNGEYSLLLGNAKGIDGPKGMGTYLWVEVENIKRLEAKLVEGPYIHHCVGIHKNVVPVLYEACKYIGVTPDLYDPIEEDVKAYLRGE